ncbi:MULTISPECIES: hypothetical protein [Bacillus cereus group]|uniref:Uncharacterized protein n=1 Tax=Bacillus cereus 03BB108 TaxID=451709 RepID=A0AAN0W4F7_BACCE|nr:hypothetical protein [Bacillus cereus]AJI08754.1 hypothetical protein AK40_5780 [Bacillus cereus 03BB108]EDX60067.1 hypothetical protein BC03BB108_B0089 [Bacillus cereus 03BB108]QKG99245.1 hypothetical protein FOC96_03010 [Bacillus cereus]HDR7255029.1 hypothetical protein [Bacillus pacificus]
MYQVNQNGSATLSSNKENKNKHYRMIYNLELNDISLTINLNSILYLKTKHNEFYIDKYIIPELKKCFWRTALKYGTAVRFLENKLDCGYLVLKNTRYKVTAFKSEDYIKNDVLISGTIYNLKIAEETSTSTITSYIEDEKQTWNKLLLVDSYKKWCSLNNIEILEAKQLDDILKDIIFSYLEKDIYSFISLVFPSDEEKANSFYNYLGKVQKKILQLVGENNSPLTQLKFALYTTRFKSKLVFNLKLQSYEKVCIVSEDTIKQIKHFIHKKIPTVGLLIDYVEQFKGEYGEILIHESTEEHELVEDLFFYWFFKINKRNINRRNQA